MRSRGRVAKAARPFRFGRSSKTEGTRRRVSCGSFAFISEFERRCIFHKGEILGSERKISQTKESLMDWMKTWIKPALLIIVWITVLSYTISMVATVEPTLRRIGQTPAQSARPVPPRT